MYRYKITGFLYKKKESEIINRICYILNSVRERLSLYVHICLTHITTKIKLDNI
jgi:hypothetical protein